MANKKLTKTTITSIIAGALATTAFAAGVIPTAMAEETSSPTITVNVVGADSGNGAYSGVDLSNHSLKFYYLGLYTSKNVSYDSESGEPLLTGYDIEAVNTDTSNAILNAIKSVLIAEDGTVASGFESVINSDGEFIGEASGETPIRFLVRYFYGNGTDTWGNKHANNAQLRKFADYIQNQSNLSFALGNYAVDDNTGVFTAQQEGLYLIVDTGTPNAEDINGTGYVGSYSMIVGTTATVDDQTVSKLVFNGDYGDIVDLGQINIKASNVSVDKEITGRDVLVSLYQKVPFDITANVPDYDAGALDGEPVYEITDTPSAGVEIDYDTLTVAVKNSSTLTEDDYTLTKNDDGSFVIALTNPTAFSGKTITVHYEATITDMSDTTLNNTATVKYTNNPYVSTKTSEVVSDPEDVSRADLYLSKVAYGTDTSAAYDGLEGAVFKVSGNLGFRGFVQDENGNYELVSTKDTDHIDDDDIITKITVNKNTWLKGLAGDGNNTQTLTFTETQAPDGYVRGSKPLTFTVKIDSEYDDDGELTDVKVHVSSSTHADYIDSRHTVPLNDNTQTDPDTSVWSQSEAASAYKVGTTYIAGAAAENKSALTTTAMTGGEIMAFALVALGLATVGTGIMVATKRHQAKAAEAETSQSV